MEVTEKELKYMLQLLDGITEPLYDEIIAVYYDVIEKKQCGDLSPNLVELFRENLRSNPVTTARVLTCFQHQATRTDPKLATIQQLYLDTLIDKIADATKTQTLISIISLIEFEDEFLPKFIDGVLSKIPDDVFRQHRKQIFISLISHRRPELLRICSEHLKSKEAREFKLTPEYMLELCYIENQHWLLKAVDVYKYQLHDMKKVTFKINNFTKQILVLVLIDIVNNQDNYDFPSTVNQLKNVFSILNTYISTDKQLQFYITELKREFAIVQFCLENNCKLLSMGVFEQVLRQSALSVVSQLCRLSRVDRYKVSRLLSANNDFVSKLRAYTDVAEPQDKRANWDTVVYNSYCAITTVIDIVTDAESADDPQKLTSCLDRVKRLILSLQPIGYCIEIIENIFSILFLRHEYFSCEEHGQDSAFGSHSDCSYFMLKKSQNRRHSGVGFVCSSLTTQIVLAALKESIAVIEGSASELEESDSERLVHMTSLVNHAIWKVGLVSSLTADAAAPSPRLSADYVDARASSDDEEEDACTSRRHRSQRRRYHHAKSDTDHLDSSCLSSSMHGSHGNIEFTSLMLGTPNCLVALALHHNDFTRAQQIIEMFDLGDAEIATEVVFTEKLRHLVAKINNTLVQDQGHRYPMKELSPYSMISTEVTSLVEGFLSANRAPSSHDLAELAARHPHLQMYDQSNAPLVHVTDLLLSTGLNREITYGLIAILERKLSQVRGTEVASKKTNYIQMVEELVSVMFEILGDTPRSHEYAENACDVVADCRIPLRHKDFNKLDQLSIELQKSCDEFLNSSDEADKATSQKRHQTYMNIVAIVDKDICNVSESHSKKSRIHYLRMCYIYAKNIAHLETEEKSDSDNDYFNILDKHLHNLIGELVYEKNVPVTSLESVCKKLSINLIHKLVLNFCPLITLIPHKEASEARFNNLLQLVYEFKNTEENLFVDPSTNLAALPRAPDAQCITYLVLHNWVLANIVKKIHTDPTDLTLQQSIDSRTRYLNNYMDLERFEYLKVLYGGNRYLASFHMNVDLDALFEFLPRLIETSKIVKCLILIDSLSEQQMLCSPNLMNLRDLLLFKLATNESVDANWKYGLHIRCAELQVNLVLNNLSSWSLEGAMEVLEYLKYLLHPVVKEDGLYHKCNDWMTRIPLYDQIACIISKNHWYDAFEKSIENADEIVEILMDSQQFKLCLEWADLHEVSHNMKGLMVSNLLRQLFHYADVATRGSVEELLSRLPASQAVQLVHDNIRNIRNLDLLRACVDFACENSADSRQFENVRMGVLIMGEIDEELRYLFWELIEKPLLMVEQFLMNAKLDRLAVVLSKIASALVTDPAGDNLYYDIESIDSLLISRNAVDALLRHYAEKSLDLKSRGDARGPRPTDEVLLLSIDSINLESAAGPFVMPDQVPPKKQWVDDYSSDKCMLCKIAIFSMIIRRHHCRRCGRLVCHACSRNRMQVPTYPQGVKLRVCDDCYRQSNVRKHPEQDGAGGVASSTSESGGSSGGGLDWCLSADARRNRAVRAEFAYEFTPNVMLCLTIMRMHSDNLDYPRFLLDRSDEVAKNVCESGSPRLLVRARRCLLLAAAEIYSRHTQDNAMGSVAEAGAAHTLRCLAHADASATLVEHAAHHLLPPQGAAPGHLVRSLLEAERWELALEVATKSGLSRTSVLAAWGKACLKAGCFRQARDKFAHCFRSSVHLNASVAEEECEFGKEAAESWSATKRPVQRSRRSERSASLTSVQSDTRPRTNPPLLDEIVAILETSSYPINPVLLAKADTIQSSNEKLASSNAGGKRLHLSEPALNIMNALASVQRIKHGDYSDFSLAQHTKKPNALGMLLRSTSQEPARNLAKMDPFFYKECVYYLSNYGSHAANIAFHMKHSAIADVLAYCRDSAVDNVTFTDIVYMECLRRDKVDELVKCMYDMDPTLNTWAEYTTHACRTLETCGRLEALYALQCSTGQHARAAATCARLYSRALSRTDTPHQQLAARAHHLAAATHHLMQCIPSERSRHKSFHLQLDKATLDKHLTTISRQMELANFLAKCESTRRLDDKMMREVIGTGGESADYRPLTMFGSHADRARLATLALVAGDSVRDGFSLAYRIINDSKLDDAAVMAAATRYLVAAERFAEVRDLSACIRETRAPGAVPLSDQTLQAGVVAVVGRCAVTGRLHDEIAELLIQDIHSVSVKISCYLECRILSTAYILAVRYERTNDLRRILREAERLGDDRVRAACVKRLTSNNML